MNSYFNTRIYRQWPSVCVRRYCACHYFNFYKFLQFNTLCFWCTNSNLPHPHPKKVNADAEDFDERLQTLEIINIYSLFPEYLDNYLPRIISCERMHEIHQTSEEDVHDGGDSELRE